MVRVTVWPQLLLVVLILRQSAAQSEQLERDIEHLVKNIPISQATTKELNESEAVNSGLKKQLEVKEEDLKSINEKQTELQTTIDGLTKSVKSLNLTSHLRCGTPEYVCQALIVAAKWGDVDSVKSLVKCDSNDSCTSRDDDYRITPLICAATFGHVEVVRVLLEGGANVDRVDFERRTALHWVAICGHPDVCRLLLDWGAKVDALNKWQMTPLHYAALMGHLSVVKLLVERGADVSVKNVDGKTASELARLFKKEDVADWLDLVRRG